MGFFAVHLCHGTAVEMGTWDFAYMQNGDSREQSWKPPSLAGTYTPLSNSVPIWLFCKISSLGIAQETAVERKQKLCPFGQHSETFGSLMQPKSQSRGQISLTAG